jgi:hypothetical protein
MNKNNRSLKFSCAVHTLFILLLFQTFVVSRLECKSIYTVQQLACMHLLSAYEGENHERRGTLRMRQQGEMPSRKNGAEKLGVGALYLFGASFVGPWGRTQGERPVAPWLQRTWRRATWASLSIKQ